jgi:hypothetical protein
MDAKVILEAAAAASAIVVAALSYWFAKWKEREADWRKWKYEQYKDFILSLSGIAGSDHSDEGVKHFARASNTMHLIGSTGVLDALHAFQEEIRSTNPHQNPALADQLLSKLVWEIRHDLGISTISDSDEFTVRLWSSGTKTH